MQTFTFRVGDTELEVRDETTGPATRFANIAFRERIENSVGFWRESSETRNLFIWTPTEVLS